MARRPLALVLCLLGLHCGDSGGVVGSPSAAVDASDDRSSAPVDRDDASPAHEAAAPGPPEIEEGDDRATTDASDRIEGSPDAAPPNASCMGSTHPVCLDFESGSLDGKWSKPPTNAKVESGKAAHGTHAMHFSGFKGGLSTVIDTTSLGAITNVIWGRFYLYMSPGAPTGHGGMVRAVDDAGNWYELGFEWNSYLGNWHQGRYTALEKAMNSNYVIPHEKWTCVEFLFDGATPNIAQIWSDGDPITYYKVKDYCTGTGCTLTLPKAAKFASFDIGIEFYHGISLDPNMWAGDGAPFITDMWLDDVALDTQRVGCL